MNIKHYTHCPECGEKWIGNPIPQEDWHKYDPPYFYYHLIEYCNLTPENKFIYECPGCRLFFPPYYDPKKTDIHTWNAILNTYAQLKDSLRCGGCGDMEITEEMLREFEELVIIKEDK